MFVRLNSDYQELNVYIDTYYKYHSNDNIFIDCDIIVLKKLLEKLILKSNI